MEFFILGQLVIIDFRRSRNQSALALSLKSKNKVKGTTLPLISSRIEGLRAQKIGQSLLVRGRPSVEVLPQANGAYNTIQVIYAMPKLSSFVKSLLRMLATESSYLFNIRKFGSEQLQKKLSISQQAFAPLQVTIDLQGNIPAGTLQVLNKFCSRETSGQAKLLKLRTEDIKSFRGFS
ncbi:MAG: hypothetical protein ACK5NG_11365 [Chthoniobacterales bacterium]